MKCLNAECKNELNSYEEVKIKGIRYNKKRFCFVCRQKIKNIKSINCLNCNSMIMINGLKVICSDCRKRQRSHYVKRRGNVRKDPIFTNIINFINEKPRSTMELCEKFNLTPKRLFPFIGHIRRRGIKIETYYKTLN